MIEGVRKLSVVRMFSSLMITQNARVSSHRTLMDVVIALSFPDEQ
jgi:hypothetical protein